LVGSGADARGEVGQQSDLCTCMAEPFVGGFRQAITRLGNVILFHCPLRRCELNNLRNEHVAIVTSHVLVARQRDGGS